jgi:alpha-tubulin suppressor-like RCC1 family protein
MQRQSRRTGWSALVVLMLLGSMLPPAAAVVQAQPLREANPVWSWGDNSQGELGNGGVCTPATTPVVSNVCGSLSPQSSLVVDAAVVAAGANHSLALRADSTVMAWGSNAEGGLGDGTETNRLTPITVAGLPRVETVAAGVNYSLALLKDGTIRAWGANDVGQLGTGTACSAPVGTGCGTFTPVAVAGSSGVSGMAAGAEHTLALKTDGTVSSWGSNLTGQLGDSTPIGVVKFRASTAQVAGLSDVVAVAAGAVTASRS